MNLQFAAGHNNSGNLAVFTYEPEITKHLDFDNEYTANGVAKGIGGGALQVRWNYLERDEFIALMQQFGISHVTPSVEGTFLIPDWFRIPSIMNGQITFKSPNEGDGFFTNIVADITGLAYL